MALEQAIIMAKDIGCEAQANGITSLLAYQQELDIDPREDIASAYGVASWGEIPDGDRALIVQAFREGKKREKDLNRL